MNALDKVLAVLEAFLDEGEELRLSDLAEQTGLNKSTIHVIAGGLIDRGYLVQMSKRGKYFLGLKFLEFAKVVERHLNIRTIAVPFMQELLAEINETVELAMRDGNVATLVLSAEPNRLLSVSGSGKWAARLPLHQTACGKVLAAFVDADEWQAMRRTLELWPGTQYTITTLVGLERELARVRLEGLAVDDEEAELGIRSIAAPVMDAAGNVVAAVDVIGPTLRLTDEMMDVYKPLVRSCAGGISRALGYSAPDGAFEKASAAI